MEPMKPMAPMKPMEPMKPMQPMQPMQQQAPWWPQDLGQPSTSGSQNSVHYAFFGDKHRLAIQTDGKTTVYDSGDHRISGVQQAQGGGQHLSFTSQHGTVDLGSLKQV